MPPNFSEAFVIAPNVLRSDEFNYLKSVMKENLGSLLKILVDFYLKMKKESTF